MQNKADITILTDTVRAELTKIQELFDEYQKGYFKAKSREFFSLELCGEAGELANLEKKRWKGRSIDPERFADEAADVFIALSNYANAAGVDLGRAVSEKLNKIELMRRESVARGEDY